MRKEITCLGNGFVILRIGKYMHTYGDMQHLASDLEHYYCDKTVVGWEGNEYNELHNESFEHNDYTTINLYNPFIWPRCIDSGSVALKELAQYFLSCRHKIEIS